MASPDAIANRLRDLEDALDAGTEAMKTAVKELERLGREASAAEMAAEVAYARVFLATEGTENTRKQTAIAQTAQLRHAARIAAHLVVTQKEAMWALREAQKSTHAKIDVARTISADTRAVLEIDKVNWRP